MKDPRQTIVAEPNSNRTVKPFRIDEELFRKIEDFKDKVLLARENGDEWVETSKEVIQYFNPKGLGMCPLTKKENRHFTYSGVKVCEDGKAEEIDEVLNTQIEQLVFGTKVPTIENR